MTIWPVLRRWPFLGWMWLSVCSTGKCKILMATSTTSRTEPEYLQWLAAWHDIWELGLRLCWVYSDPLRFGRFFSHVVCSCRQPVRGKRFPLGIPECCRFKRHCGIKQPSMVVSESFLQFWQHPTLKGAWRLWHRGGRGEGLKIPLAQHGIDCRNTKLQRMTLRRVGNRKPESSWKSLVEASASNTKICPPCGSVWLSHEVATSWGESFEGGLHSWEQELRMARFLFPHILP